MSTDGSIRRPVLIVDDEDDMCWALQTIIENEGHRPTIASSAREAMIRAEETPFDLAFVDLKLPDMEGLELVSNLRRRLPLLPCVLVSGFLYDDDETVRAGFRDGLICAFIGKPFLLEQVRQALELAFTVVERVP